MRGWIALALQHRADLDANGPVPSGGYAASLLQSVVVLIAVSVIAWWVLRWVARRNGASGELRAMKILERMPLDPRRSLYLVRIGSRVLLVGSSEQSLSLLTEIRADELPESSGTEPTRTLPSFAELVDRFRGRAPSNTDTEEPAPSGEKSPPSV